MILAAVVELCHLGQHLVKVDRYARHAGRQSVECARHVLDMSLEMGCVDICIPTCVDIGDGVCFSIQPCEVRVLTLAQALAFHMCADTKCCGPHRFQLSGMGGKRCAVCVVR